MSETASDLSAVLSYKSVYVLNKIEADYKLRATHYACCLVYGREPIWGVWTINGNFVRFFGRKSEIADAYPEKTWRRKAASWSLGEVHGRSVDQRRAELEVRYGMPVPHRRN